LHFQAHAAESAGKAGGGDGVQAKPDTPDAQVVTRKELDQRGNQESVSPRDDDE
jgi:hypothetical protein